ncbi:MAG: DUF2442 domain-containing protein [Azonexus sp.]|uniref:Uncharacterized protein DUF2442 n=1 Tax=Gulbenkiania mobilis TaxID=397457 RepID=A0ABY2CVR8_GULMO|nr:uncharacterized protein DUF2442 [Gulbenkiania mobilis]
MTPDVILVRPLPDYTLVAQFATGEWRRFDMRSYLHYPAFAALQDPALFQRAHVEHGAVTWTDEIDLSPDTLYLRGESVPGAEA